MTKEKLVIFNESAKELSKNALYLVVIYLVSIFLLVKAHEFHLILGLLLSLAYGYAIYLGIKDLRNNDAHEISLPKGVRIFCILVLLGAAVFSSISYVLHTLSLAVYDSDVDLTLYHFNFFYTGTFLDMLPGLNILETLDIKLPCEPSGLAAGLPVVVFRAFVIFGLLGSLKVWWNQLDNMKS